MTDSVRMWRGGSSAFVLMLSAVGAHGQPATQSTGDQAPAALDEITVTARKREESIQNVPISVTAVGPNLIDRNNITTIDQVASLAPNVTAQPIGQVPTNASLYIRGIGTYNAEPGQDVPIAISIDGVYLTNVAGSLLDVFDVQQIEVLRGPQGTLQGRNSPGGALNITTLRPDGEYHARAEASYGNFDESHVKGEVEAPIVQGVLSGKLSGFRSNGGDYMNNVVYGTKTGGGTDNWGGRAGLLFTPVDSFKAYLTADFLHDASPQAALRPVPHSATLGSAANGSLEPPPAVCTVYSYCTPYGQYQTGAENIAHNLSDDSGVGLNADWDLSAVKFTSVTGYRVVNETVNLDLDALPVPILEFAGRTTRVRAFSQEMRLASNGGGPFTYVFGAIVTRSYFSLVQPAVLGGALAGVPEIPSLTLVSDRDQVTRSYAEFGQAVYQFTDEWSVSGGMRETHDQKRMLSQPAGAPEAGEFSASFSNFSVEAGTEYRFDQTKMAYFRFSQGYRGGGINGDASSLAAINTYRPETVNSFEVGFKSDWLNRRLVADVSAFHYDYKDLQILALSAYAGGFTQRIVNARGLNVNGLEIESSVRATDNLTLNGNFGYLDAKYRTQELNLGEGDVNMANLRKDYAPKVTAHLDLDYTQPLGAAGFLDLSAGASYKSELATSSDPYVTSLQPAYALVNSSLKYSSLDKRYDVSLYCENMTNKFYILSGSTAGGLVAEQIVGRPRSYGVKTSVKF